MKISNALIAARQILSDKKIDSYKIDSLVLLCHILQCNKEKIIFNPDLDLTSLQEENFFDLVKRRANFEPVSHLIGKREFFGSDFIVSKDVLDPRPDSENLIELILENFTQDKKFNFLELGVGSGCLLISLLLSFPNAAAIGVDISDKALNIAKQNAKLLDVLPRVNFIESDLFTNISSKFDLIISNPPYIKTADINNLQNEVKFFEPKLALDGGEDGLDFYRKIAKNAQKFLTKEGKLVVEIGYGQKDDIVAIFTENNWVFKDLKCDLGGVERVLLFEL